ncbi:MAG: DsbE family thiol:disulfide interchange protein [Aquabacterium sp.]|uniref:DsbE family thiol:disulfide interchange protein n=1 Tax=Aquabacterium sp. TaxID=1872578 RepID=UPI00121A4594|nr:DsbE family thiol:disulfide interchange protein [Aquabacterium sp.]TAK99667.1 MAG: DsbE family thiol:disulfide interchange protein [Aquabacterium sp.]
MKRFLLPIGLFLAMACTLALALKRGDPQEIPSLLVGKPVPAFNLTQLEDASKSFGPQNLKGQVWLLNVWASWCTSCRKEHPLLLDFAKQGVVPIIGFNYQDQREAGLATLKEHGNPYQLTAFDADGRAGMDLGVIGVPETFVVDKQGRIRFKFTGPITPEVLKDKLLPLIKELKRG